VVRRESFEKVVTGNAARTHQRLSNGDHHLGVVAVMQHVGSFEGPVEACVQSIVAMRHHLERST
jgi:hypothetical protein